jgi:hypothetical protein
VTSKRFQIEEMLSQDANGAMFLALDAETGKEVLLQRFFPFGVGSGGLGGSELESYNLALERMKSIEHRSLRRVLDGGCDPVDGIPFLIFEGREGVTLADFFSSGPITTEQGVVLVEYALKLMLEIEKLFGDKMDWLMMDASGVEVLDNGNGFRFCLDPMKWVGIKKGQGPVKDLATLLETAMGWSSAKSRSGADGQLSRWVALAKSEDWSCDQALQALRSESAEDASGSGQRLPDPSFPQIVLPPPTFRSTPIPQGPILHRKKIAPPVSLVAPKKSNSASWMALCFALTGAAIIALIVLLVIRPDQDKLVNSEAPELASKVVPTTVPPRVEIPRKVAANGAPSTPQSAPTPQIVAPLEGNPTADEAKVEDPSKPKREGDYKPEDVSLLRDQLRKEVTILGRVNRVRTSNSEKSLYIEFGSDPEENVCGRYMNKLGKEDMSVSELGNLKGKMVRLKGLVQEEFGTKRIVINLMTRDQVMELP